MQVSKKQLSPTNIKLTIVADEALLAEVKQRVLREAGETLKLPGFRAGKVPAELVEKNANPETLQSQFLEQAVNRMYTAAITDNKLRPVSNPKVSVTKFVPFSTVEIETEVEVIGEITLPDYKKFRLAPKKVEVTAKDVDEVLANLRSRAAERKEVARASKEGDQVTMDFKGVDAKTKEAIAGADGQDYPIVIGSGTFIPGFEPQLVGLKAGQSKDFDITFPKDYGAEHLQSKKVTFSVIVKKVEELLEPKLDDKFAASVGPFKTMAELKADIKKQLTAEREQQARQAYESELLEKLAEKTEVAIPTSLVDEEIERQEADEKQNLAYRGQTWQEHLKAEGVNEEQHREQKRPGAELRVKAGLVLSEVADREGIAVTPQELDIRLNLLKGQYPDEKMQAEFDKPEARRDILSRLLTEKTIALLADFASAK